MDYNQLTKDFNQRYSNSWVWLTLPDSSEKFVLLVKAFQKDGSNSYPYIEFYSEELGQNLIKFTTNYSIKFRRPPIGVYQDDKHALCLMRSISQTYSKGVNGETYFLSPVFKPGIQFVHFSGAWDTAYGWGSSVEKAFSPKFKDKYEAIKLLEKGKAVSVALSNRISLCLSGTDSDSYDVYHYTTYIGKVDKNGEPKFDKLNLGISEI